MHRSPRKALFTRLPIHYFHLVLLCCTSFLAQPSCGWAQKSSSTNSSAIDLIREQKNPILIDSLSLSRYEAALLPGLANIITDHDLVVPAHAAPPKELVFDSAWLNESLKGGTRELINGSASPNIKSTRGPAFGAIDELIAEEDVILRAQKLLWNAVSIFESNRFFESTLKISWATGANRASDAVSINLTRLHPAMLGQTQIVAMRELLKVQEPEWLSLLSFLTLRQYGNNEDSLWFHSPTLKTTRELVGSLRGDPLFGSLFSLDDLFLFSAKPELLTPTTSVLLETLVPFVNPTKQLQLANSPSEPTCRLFQSSNQEAGNPLAAMVFAPRKVIAIELQQRDAFSQTGRQKLYIDAISMIPVFKEIYSLDGKLSKSFLGTFTSITTPPKQETHIMPHSIIGFGVSGQISMLQTLAGKTCSSLPKDFSLKLLDPANL